MLNFSFSEGLGLVLHHILCMIFQEKYFSCYILLAHQISLSDCLYFSRYWAICVLHLFVNQADIRNLEIKLIFLIKPLRYMTKKSRQKFKYLENEKSLWGEKKAFFFFFKGIKKLFHITKFILVFPTFQLIQQSLSRTRSSMKSFNSVLKLLSKSHITKLKSAKNSCDKRTTLKMNELQQNESIPWLIIWWNFVP